MAVLQRTSLCYAIVVAIHIATQYGEKHLRKYGAMFVAFMMAVYIVFMMSFSDGPNCTLQNNLTKACNFGSWFDKNVLTEKHMLGTTDSEGLFSTLSSITTAYGGYIFCLMMKDIKNDKRLLIRQWLSYAVFFIVSSLPLSLLMPYNKKIWSASFALLSVGIPGVMLVLSLLLIDVAGAPGGRFAPCIDIATRPLLWLGMNPLAIYVFLHLQVIYVRRTMFDGRPKPFLFYDYAFSSWISDPVVCSTVYSCFFTLLWVAVAGIMFKLKIFVKL